LQRWSCWCSLCQIDHFYSRLTILPQGALMCILGTMIAAVLPVLAYIFVSPAGKASYCYEIWTLVAFLQH